MFPQIPTLLQRAVQHFQQGELAPARRLLEQVLTAQPRQFDALHILGVVRGLQGETSAAIELFRKALAINKNNNFLHFNLAKALSEAGLDEEALPHHRQATRLAPDHVQAWLGYGQSLARLQRPQDALAAYDEALARSPDYADALNNKGLVLSQLQRHSEALQALDRALQLQPALVEAHYNRGVVLDAMEHPERALESYDRALALQPDHLDALNNRGAILAGLGRYDEALNCYDRVLALQPFHARAWNNKGSALVQLGRDADAMACYEQAVRINPQYADAQLTLGHLFIAAGRWREGWEKTEFRWQASDAPPTPVPTVRPRWEGDAADRPLLLWGEQGIGDQILYASILPELAALPQKKYVALDKRLLPLFERSMPGFEFIDLATVSDALDFAEQLPLGSLPRLFRPDLASFAAARHPFLQADPARAAALRAQIARPGKEICGVSWSSNRKGLGQHKSIGLAQMLAPLACDALHFVDLQYGDTAAERRQLEQEHGIAVQHVDEVDNFNDIDGLAALIQACDIVLTTSNSTAHLAGALGKETWLLLPLGKGRLWYWFEYDGRNLWYPSIHSCTQTEAGKWDDSLRRLSQQLEKHPWN